VQSPVSISDKPRIEEQKGGWPFLGMLSLLLVILTFKVTDGLRKMIIKMDVFCVICNVLTKALIGNLGTLSSRFPKLPWLMSGSQKWFASLLDRRSSE